MKRAGIALVLWLTLASTAFALDTDNYTEYDFEDDLVQGDLVRPDGELLTSRRPWEHMSLIRVRDNFIDRLIESMNWL